MRCIAEPPQWRQRRNQKATTSTAELSDCLAVGPGQTFGFVYKPESRMKGLHDSFSNKLSWMSVPSWPVDDISTGSHAHRLHTRTWTRTCSARPKLCDIRLPTLAITPKMKKTITATRQFTLADGCGGVVTSWPELTNQIACQSSCCIQEPRGDFNRCDVKIQYEV